MHERAEATQCLVWTDRKSKRHSRAPPNRARPVCPMATPQLKIACLLERYYNFSLESTLQDIGFADENVNFVKPVSPSDDVVTGTLNAADYEWAAQHASVWRACAAGDSAMLIFQENVTFSASCSNVLEATKALVTLAAEQTDGDARVLMLSGNGAVPGQSSSYELSRLHSVSHAIAYVLWPKAASSLVDSLPLDGSLTAFIGRHVEDGGIVAVLASPPLAECTS